MNRRGFLGAIAGGLVLDHERLLWRPGAKLISIPRRPPFVPFVVVLPESYEQTLTYQLALAMLEGRSVNKPQPTLRFHRALLLAGLAR